MLNCYDPQVELSHFEESHVPVEELELLESFDLLLHAETNRSNTIKNNTIIFFINNFLLEILSLLFCWTLSESAQFIDRYAVKVIPFVL